MIFIAFEIIETANLRSVSPARLIALLYPSDISLQISSFFEPNMTAGKFSLFRVTNIIFAGPLLLIPCCAWNNSNKITFHTSRD